jgi:nucleotide-binding universal stress UspA family protein
LQRLGATVFAVPTTLLSNTPHYPTIAGGPLDPALIEALLDRLLDRAPPAGIGAILTGYIASPGAAASAARFIDRVRTAHAGVLFLCDPVMGDTDTGLYVDEAVATAITEELVPRADILTPNLFEARRLTGLPEGDPDADARIIVMGRKGAGSGENVKALGSHIEQIIRRVHTPVLIVSRDFVEPKDFMLAYDGRETADKAVKRIIEGGLLYNMTCHLVTVNNNQAGLFDKFKSTEAMLVEHGFNVQSSFLEGNVFNVLMDYKKDQHVDLLVMGAFSRSKLATVFLGSNTLKMIENTLRPLLVLR